MTQRQFRLLSWCLFVLGTSFGFLLIGCSGKNKDQGRSTDGKSTDKAADPDLQGPALFEDVTAQTGINFGHHNGEDKGHLAIVESLGGGVGVIDFDGDGLLDVFIVGGGTFEKTDKELGPRPAQDAPPPKTLRECKILGRPCKLYRNLGNLKFQDVSEQVFQIEGDWPFSHGVTVTDYDCDGWPDLLVTGWGRVVLLHNEADPKDPSKRRLVDRTLKAGLTHKAWSSSAAAGDLDGDGYPELFILFYADWSFAKHPVSTYDGKTRDVAPPKMFAGLPDKVYRNLGNGTFKDVSDQAGVSFDKEGRSRAHEVSDKGLGVLMIDLNQDGKPEVYVCNDTVDNYLYFNQSTAGIVKLWELGYESSTARDDRGAPNGSMGIDAADYDGRGIASLFVTNFENEKHALYHNDWQPGVKPETHFFTHYTSESRIASIGQTFVSWGTGFLDVENRGWEDLMIVSGHIMRFPTVPGSTREQRPVLLRNLGNGTFKDLSKRGGGYFQKIYNGRGLALADLDNDGRVDMVISYINSPVSVVRNVSPPSNHWLGVQLRGKDNRDVVGARFSVEAAGRLQWRFAKGGGSYASARDQRHVVGLGAADKVGRVTVHWPDGTQQPFDGLPPDRYYRLTQGKVEAEPLYGQR